VKWKIFVLVLLVCFFTNASAIASGGRVRHVPVVGDQIVTVRTAVGIATIIQVPDTPSSVVVGDQEGFRVEYLDRAITIKPLRIPARSNLYVYTDSRRFNVQLTTGGEAEADYVVYLDLPRPTPRAVGHPTTWTPIEKVLSLGDFRLSTTRLGKTASGVLLVEFEVTSGQPSRFDPGWIWLTQDGTTRPIQSLFLSKSEVGPGNPIRGALQILRSDLNSAAPFRIELRKGKTAYLTLPKVALWR